MKNLKQFLNENRLNEKAPSFKSNNDGIQTLKSVKFELESQRNAVGGMSKDEGVSDSDITKIFKNLKSLITVIDKAIKKA